MGGSYGGYLTATLTTRTDRFAAAVVERGYLDATSFVGSSDIGWFFPGEYHGSPEGGGRPEPDDPRRPGHHPDAGDPLRGRLALPGRAGAALVRGAAAARRTHRAAAVPRRGPRAQPQRPARATAGSASSTSCAGGPSTCRWAEPARRPARTRRRWARRAAAPRLAAMARASRLRAPADRASATSTGSSTFVDAVDGDRRSRCSSSPLAEAAADLGQGSVGDLLRDNSEKLLGFVLSFLVIAQLWFAQHRVVERRSWCRTGCATRLLLGWTLHDRAPAASRPRWSRRRGTTRHQASSTSARWPPARRCSRCWPGRSGATGRSATPTPGPTPPRPRRRWSAFGVALAISLLLPVTSYYPLLLLLLTDPLGCTRWRRTRA